MPVYVKIGTVDYQRSPVPINSRAAWEFCACAKGRMAAWLSDRDDHDEVLRGRTFWAFLQGYPHGWRGAAPCERIVFQFRTVPEELERLLPDRGYYRVTLSRADCSRLRLLATQAVAATLRPTELVSLQDQVLVAELSLLALRETRPRPLAHVQLARQKTSQALAWYAEHMSESPRFREDVAPAVHVSPAHLRRLFYQALKESPHEAFKRLRMSQAETLLRTTDLSLEAISERVGFSSASALSRAIKANGGLTPRELRNRGGTL